MSKQEFECAWCGKKIMRYAKNPKGKDIKNHFCDKTCKGKWQMEQKPLNKEQLEELYLTQRKSANEIAKMVNRNSKRVWEWLKEYGIPTRPRGSDYGQYFQKGQTGYWSGKTLSDEAKEKIRQARKRDGRVPYLVNGEHWLHAYPERHPASWKGGVTPERQEIYASKEWKKAVQTVWRRDNATCRLCNKRFKAGMKTFEIHHVYPFAEYSNMRTNPDALALLCPECHKFVHSKKNTENKFMLKKIIFPDWLKGYSKCLTKNETNI